MPQAVDLIQSVEHQSMEKGGERPEVAPGDTVNVHVRIVEGSRERVQAYQGVVIAVKGSGMNKAFTVRRVASHGIGVERTFRFYSPRIEKIELVSKGRVRRSRLFYLRERRGKAARIKERGLN